MPDPPATSAPTATPAATAAAKTATAAAATATAAKAATTAAASKLPDDFSKHLHGLPYGDDDFAGFNHSSLGVPHSDFNSKYKYNANDYKWNDNYDYYGMDWKHRWMDRAYHALTIICILIIASWVLQFIMYRKHDVLEWIKRRRMAAKVRGRTRNGLDHG